jgi:hypothetical protein
VVVLLGAPVVDVLGVPVVLVLGVPVVEVLGVPVVEVLGVPVVLVLSVPVVLVAPVVAPPVVPPVGPLWGGGAGRGARRSFGSAPTDTRGGVLAEPDGRAIFFAPDGGAAGSSSPAVALPIKRAAPNRSTAADARAILMRAALTYSPSCAAGSSRGSCSGRHVRSGSRA